MRAEWVVVVSAVGWWVSAGGRAPALPWRKRREVVTAQGEVRGYLGSSYYAFLGVPYAGPPTFEDRFKAPEPPPTWDGIFEATHRVRCPQTGAGADENCLVVNVFAAESLPPRPIPVLVFLHDGGFNSGWGELQPPLRFLDDYIVVTFNYRLGTLGFLCLGLPEAPGNAGLKDQLAALYWVQQNIAAFGGNPDDVTVYGVGAGAISIQLLILSGLAKGLMHRAILDSGSVLSPSSMTYNPSATAIDVALSLGYQDNGDNEELLQFYRDLPVKDLVNISTNFLPCVENSLLYAHSMIDQDPLDILVKGNFDKIPIMLIYTKSQEMKLIDQNYDKFVMIPELFEDLLPTNLQFDSDTAKFKIAELVKDFYFDEFEHHADDKVIQSYKEYINDIFMEYPVYKLATMYAAKSPVPVYVMKFDPEDGMGEGSGSYGTVLQYIFAKDLPEEHVKVANILASLLNNFMRMGDPTPLITELVPVMWEPLNPHGLDTVSMNRPCLIFGSTLSVTEPPAIQQINFWDYVYTKYYKKFTFDGE